jgi:predicted MPP superfamily phosphohydrolase
MPGFPSLSAEHITRRNFLIGTGATVAGLALYSGEIARHEIDIIHRPITIANLPAPFHGFRIAQISDIHLDEFTEPYFLERVIRHVNALNADMVLITGDFVTMGAFTFVSATHAARRCAELLATLTSPLRYAILGNHDVTVGAAMVTSALTAHGTPVLINQHVPIERNGSRLWLCGAEDPGTSHPDLYLTVPAKPDGPVILMAHEPDFADVVTNHPRGPLVDLMLSGHTHGGQIKLPFLGPLVLPPMGKKYAHGSFQFNRMQLYVNRGLGTVGIPFRLNCPPEITLLTLQPVVPA